MRWEERISAAIARCGAPLCIGLDPMLEHLPQHLPRTPEAIVHFNRAIIEATAAFACAYKPNLAFYLMHGPAGIAALEETRRLIPPTHLAILDAKVGDIASTTAAYAEAFFTRWQFDAVTVQPYVGEEGLRPLLLRPEHGVFVLARTSNPGAKELQDLVVEQNGVGQPIYQVVAQRVRTWHAQHGTCGLVVGATYPAELAAVRQACPELPLLIPGIGAQAGDLAQAVAAVRQGHGPALFTATRSVIYASNGTDFAEAARQAAQSLHEALRQAFQN